MTYASIAGSPELDVYADWALIMARMTDASVGTDLWTVVQNKTHPAVTEPEFTPLDLSLLVSPYEVGVRPLCLPLEETDLSSKQTRKDRLKF